MAPILNNLFLFLVKRFRIFITIFEFQQYFQISQALDIVWYIGLNPLSARVALI